MCEVDDDVIQWKFICKQLFYIGFSEIVIIPTNNYANTITKVKDMESMSSVLNKREFICSCQIKTTIKELDKRYDMLYEWIMYMISRRLSFKIDICIEELQDFTFRFENHYWMDIFQTRPWKPVVLWKGMFITEEDLSIVFDKCNFMSAQWKQIQDVFTLSFIENIKRHNSHLLDESEGALQINFEDLKEALVLENTESSIYNISTDIISKIFKYANPYYKEKRTLASYIQQRDQILDVLIDKNICKNTIELQSLYMSSKLSPATYTSFDD